ncbi:MAG TPA: zinc dependent phospholipase C family protein [Chitinophagaceae bacterium]|nr:zinc dependent phospholipase C family protein [Chitinophagaceae bacterium]
MKRPVIKVILLFMGIHLLSSWGFLVHKTVNQLAVYQLPIKMRPFFFSNMNYIVENAIRPDQRRNTDSTEAPKHFIDLEAYGDSAAWKMPMDWDQAVKQYSKDTLLKYGYVPYHIIVMKDRLTHALRNNLKDSILFYATDLGHYIGDANVPLHTSINYDGQLSDQKGLHSLWESMIPEMEIDQYSLKGQRKAEYLKDPKLAVWQAIRHAHTLLKDVFSQEKQASAGFSDSTKFRVQVRRGREVKSFTSEFAKSYSKRLGNTIQEQIMNSANMIADFWYTAWVDAGKPDLDNISNLFDKAKKKAMRVETKAYRKDQLLDRKLMLGKAAAASD